MTSPNETPSILEDEEISNHSILDISHLPPPDTLRWILFDLDMTLWDHDKAIRHALGVICDELNHDIDPFMMHYNEQSRALWLQFSRGKISIHDLRLLRIGNVFRILGDDKSDKEIERICEHYLEIYLEFHGEMPNAYNIMCNASNYGKLGILTNATRLTQNSKINQLQGKDLLSLVLTVDETGCAKTDPNFYQHAMKEMGNPDPKTVLYVGDNWHDDVLPPARLGWNIAWIDLQRKGKPEEQPDTPVNLIHSVRNLLNYFE